MSIQSKIDQSVLCVDTIFNGVCCPMNITFSVSLQYTAVLTELPAGIFFWLDEIFLGSYFQDILTLMHISQLPQCYFDGKRDFIICHHVKAS